MRCSHCREELPEPLPRLRPDDFRRMPWSARQRRLRSTTQIVREAAKHQHGECVVGELVAVADAAAMLRLHRNRVYDLITSGRLPVVQIDGTMKIGIGEIEKYQRERVMVA